MDDLSRDKDQLLYIIPITAQKTEDKCQNNQHCTQTSRRRLAPAALLLPPPVTAVPLLLRRLHHRQRTRFAKIRRRQLVFLPTTVAVRHHLSLFHPITACIAVAAAVSVGEGGFLRHEKLPPFEPSADDGSPSVHEYLFNCIAAVGYSVLERRHERSWWRLEEKVMIERGGAWAWRPGILLGFPNVLELDPLLD